MPDKLVFTYFNSRGRGELARLIMAQGGMDFEDHRITQDEWANLKAKVPTGQLPMLEVNSTKICQSLAIAHYLAKKADLCGKNDLEAAQAEMIVHTVNDIGNKVVPIFFESDEEKKAKLLEEFEEEYLPPVVHRLEYILSNNGGKWVVGNDLTWADIALANFFGSPNFGAFFKKFELRTIAPKLFEHGKRINELPKIKEWIEKRPQTGH